MKSGVGGKETCPKRRVARNGPQIQTQANSRPIGLLPPVRQADEGSLRGLVRTPYASDCRLEANLPPSRHGGYHRLEGVWVAAGLGFRQILGSEPLSPVTQAWRGGGICREDDQGRPGVWPLSRNPRIRSEKRDRLEAVRSPSCRRAHPGSGYPGSWTSGNSGIFNYQPGMPAGYGVSGAL